MQNELHKIYFDSQWNLWYHKNKKSWKINDYKMIYEIKNIQDYWDLHNNFDLLNGINSQHFFLMKKNVLPLWEDSNNKNGGCWSIKTTVNKSFKLWINLSSYIVGNTLVKDENLINGLSICTKNNNICVIKIWNNDKNKKSINLLPKEILKEFGYNIIYKNHIPEY